MSGLLDQRDTASIQTAERDEIDIQIKRAIRILWQTRMLRDDRITVQDEIENNLSIFVRTFLTALPLVKRRMAQLFKLDQDVVAYLRLGSWVGGDRDGNPNVSPETLEYAVRRQAEAAIDHYLAEIHALGAELSLSETLVTTSQALKDLAAGGKQISVHQKDEPYRIAPDDLLCPHGRDTQNTAGHGSCPRAPVRGRALPQTGRSRRRPRHHRKLAVGKWRCRSRPGAAFEFARKCCRLWFSFGDHGCAAEQRCSRTRRGRTSENRRHGTRLSGVGRERANRASAGRIGLFPPAAFPAHRIFGRDGAGAGDIKPRQQAEDGVRGRRDFPICHLQGRHPFRSAGNRASDERSRALPAGERARGAAADRASIRNHR